MKKISLIFLVLMTVFFAACEKDKENVMIKESIAANDLGNLSGSTFVLLMDNKDQTFQTFTWTAVDYGFDAVVTYTVQMDKKANNFSSPIDLITVTNALTGSIKVGDINKLLLAAGLAPEAAADVQFRVKSTIHPSV